LELGIQNLEVQSVQHQEVRVRRQLIAGVAVAAMVAVVSTGAEPARQVTQSAKPIALVGGTLIDGFGGPPIRNSVVLVRGDGSRRRSSALLPCWRTQ
jgi:hypothetical protein